jgi:hypothetical protein
MNSQQYLAFLRELRKNMSDFLDLTTPLRENWRQITGRNCPLFAADTLEESIAALEFEIDDQDGGEEKANDFVKWAEELYAKD